MRRGRAAALIDAAGTDQRLLKDLLDRLKLEAPVKVERPARHRQMSLLEKAPRLGFATLGMALLAVASAGGAAVPPDPAAPFSSGRLAMEADERILALDPHNQAAIADLGRLGEELILINCGGNITGEVALRKGIAVVERALRLGLTAKADAFKALGCGYNIFAFDQSLSDPEQLRYRKLQRGAYQQWVDLEPNNTEALSGLSISVGPDDARRIDEKILKLDPGDADTRFVLGRYLFEEGKTTEGLAMMREAWKSPRICWEKGHDLAQYLRQVGRAAEAALVEKEADRRNREGFQ
jgi:hypothetical protein